MNEQNAKQEPPKGYRLLTDSEKKQKLPKDVLYWRNGAVEWVKVDASLAYIPRACRSHPYAARADGQTAETPETNAVAFDPFDPEDTGGLPRDLVPADFARQQERTIATLRAECAGLRDRLAYIDDLTCDVKPDEDSEAGGTIEERVEALVQYAASRATTPPVKESMTVQKL